MTSVECSENPYSRIREGTGFQFNSKSFSPPSSAPTIIVVLTDMRLYCIDSYIQLRKEPVQTDKAARRLCVW